MLLRSGDITLRAFEASLSGVVHGIRNHPSVRARLRDTRPIPRERHEQWVRENLVEARRLWLFVVYQAEAPVGIALIRNVRGRAGEIGVLMVEAEKRRLAAYKAAHLVGYYAFEVLDLEELFSLVPHRNMRAKAFNLRCGFEPTGRTIDECDELVMTQARSRTHPTHRRFRQKNFIEFMDETRNEARPS